MLFPDILLDMGNLQHFHIKSIQQFPGLVIIHNILYIKKCIQRDIYTYSQEHSFCRVFWMCHHNEELWSWSKRIWWFTTCNVLQDPATCDQQGPDCPLHLAKSCNDSVTLTTSFTDVFDVGMCNEGNLIGTVDTVRLFNEWNPTLPSNHVAPR